ncbi:MAG: SDR family oxidoreductase [Rhodospirillales bacterium]|nr:SDR family oxidoreductase [Rhodospirillales bacterium]
MSQQLFDLSGKVALITGSGRGIGLVLARGLANAGATVVLDDLTEEILNPAVESLRADGIQADGVVFDVSKPDAVAAGVSEIRKRHGKIDILINNAGIQRRFPLEEFPQSDWQDVIDVNVTGPFIVAKAVVPDMIKRKEGKIINICSLQSAVTRAGIGAYTAAKGGLSLLTRSMAVEWGPHNIQTNGIGPGYLKTKMTERLWKDPEWHKWLEERAPAGRWGMPEDLIGPAVFLSSNASGYVNGQVVFVDGGLLCGM